MLDNYQIYWILEGTTPVLCSDHVKWCSWFATANRKVAEDVVEGHLVSTIFLGINHDFLSSKPILFETMVFDGEETMQEEYHLRYSNWDDAVAGHRAILALVKLTLSPDESSHQH